MRLTVAAVGRLRAGPEQALVRDYMDRARKSGRYLGLAPIAMAEVEDRKAGGKPGEAAALEKAIPQPGRLIALDERGQLLSSPDLAHTLANWRDQGLSDTAFVIGGADGLDPALVARADLTLSFGPMVWPHMLARVMLAEQIYRSISILAGSPYHRM